MHHVYLSFPEAVPIWYDADIILLFARLVKGFSGFL